MSVDHVYPISKGGIDGKLQLTHKICNNLKGDFTIEIDCSWFKKERLRRGSKL